MSNTVPTSKPNPARIALTPGEPAGIGPDLAIMLALEAPLAAIAHFADPGLIAMRAEELGVGLRIIELRRASDAVPTAAGSIQIVPVSAAAPCSPGRPDTRNARYVLDCLDQAVAACADGNLCALVTGPLNKAVINDAGVRFSGHTEYLAERLAVALPVMLLATRDLRVALLTTHVPLHQVPALVTRELLGAVLDIVHQDVRRKFGIERPRICVCGLNPHAGEQGHLGGEEAAVLVPAIADARRRGIEVEGPLPADTAFTREQRRRFDVILAMYHDQGLTALKALSFGDAVNITLGLPIVRTSVDHGTAFDLAGRGGADPASLRAAITMAAELGTAHGG